MKMNKRMLSKKAVLTKIQLKCRVREWVLMNFDAIKPFHYHDNHLK